MLTRTIWILAVLMAALWVGSLFFLGFVVAPYLFTLAARHSPAVPNTSVAGQLVGPLLAGADVAGLVVGACLLAALFFLRRRNEVPLARKLGLAEAGIALAILCAAANHWICGPRINTVKAQLATLYGAFHQSDKTDPLYHQFGTLHRASTALFVAGFAGTFLSLVGLTQFRPMSSPRLRSDCAGP